MFNKLIASLLPYFPKRFIWMFSKKYIAGDKLEHAIDKAKELNSNGYKVTIDLLGEFINDLSEAEANKNEYLNIIDTAQKNNIDGNYSVKPTMFGLLLDKDVCYKNIREIVKKAAEYNNFVRLDMEDSQCVDMEIELLRKLKAEFPENVGLVVQAYLHRTYDDLNNLLDLNTKDIPLNFRLCKGIYVEPKEIAYKKYDEINNNYVKLLDFMFNNNIYPGIATHDKNLIDESYRLINKYNVPKDKFEFQMLLGVTPNLRKSIIDKGYNLRVYVPFGKDWFGYSTRRLKENPKMASLIIKGIFKKG